MYEGRRKRFGKFLVTGVMSILVLLSVATAAASSANISHSYDSSDQIVKGSLVSLDPAHSGYVQPSNASNGSRLLGIAVSGSDSLLAVNPTPGKVQIATSGTANGLVSTVGGAIRVGDQIGISPFSGIGMKASAGSQVIGLAQTAFDSNSQGTTAQVTDKEHKQHTVRVGYIRISIAIGANATAGSRESLTSLQKLARSITGHTVSNIRVVISLAVVLVSLLAVIALVYASIYGSIISVGRNPLAKYTVFRTLVAVLAMAVLTTLVSGMTVYLLLK